MDFAGFRSEAEMLRAWVGSMSDCAFCTRLERLNIVHGICCNGVDGAGQLSLLSSVCGR